MIAWNREEEEEKEEERERGPLAGEQKWSSCYKRMKRGREKHRENYRRVSVGKGMNQSDVKKRRRNGGKRKAR